jgi:hypothetical protein
MIELAGSERVASNARLAQWGAVDLITFAIVVIGATIRIGIGVESRQAKPYSYKETGLNHMFAL